MITAPTHPPTGTGVAPEEGERREQDQPALSVRGLRRSYGRFEAVRGIDLEIARGEIFALLGPNGAGKTTTLEILEGFRVRSGGDVDVLGVDPAHGDRAWRERIGIVLQDSQPEPELTARECLSLYAGYYSAPGSVDDTLARVGLAELGHRRCEQLSGGQRRRLDVALALVGDPELLFLDEPTTGFDPASRRAMWELVRSLPAKGTTIVLTTHYMEEAERLADRIAVIADGEIVAEGTPGSLGRRSLMAAEITFTVPVGVELSQLPVGVGATSIDQGGRVSVGCEDPVSAMFSLTRWALKHEHPLPDLELRRPTLEDVYLQLTTPADQ
jgi:ABC-2 type transport system ATP-binding protein